MFYDRIKREKDENKIMITEGLNRAFMQNYFGGNEV